MTKVRASVAVLFLLGCDGSPGDLPGYDDDLERTMRLGTAYCDLERRCCKAAGHGTAGLSDCESTFALGYAPQIVDGTLGVDARRTDACVALFERSTCSGLSQGEFEGCNAVFVGKVREGGRCRSALDCVVDGAVMCLKSSGEDGPGVCRRVPAVGRDQRCLTTMEDGERRTRVANETPAVLARCRKQDGLYCEPRDGVCADVRGLGGDCSSEEACTSGLMCLDKTCMSRQGVGAECTSGAHCASGVCRQAKCTTDLVDALVCQGT
jgi:hypothetical protein